VIFFSSSFAFDYRRHQKPDQDPKNQQNNYFILKISALPPGGPPEGGGFAN
jgi:hypothetical protein